MHLVLYFIALTCYSLTLLPAFSDFFYDPKMIAIVQMMYRRARKYFVN